MSAAVAVAAAVGVASARGRRAAVSWRAAVPCVRECAVLTPPHTPVVLQHFTLTKFTHPKIVPTPKLLILGKFM